MVYIKSYKELIVWQKSILLVKEVYLLTEKFPASELYTLTSQIRRSAISIPSNIAEGYGRNSLKDYTKFYNVAYGSALELETQLLLGKELRFINERDALKAEQLLNEVCRMLHAMIIKMKNLHLEIKTNS